ncbi:MAG: hypothetical protein HC883_06285 [Bdellovibrionaceae bacterium]|nr:hypothetical protein [Pseudobdellovibrionaceae bacterium]
MRLISRLRGRCFCAFCKAERKVYVKKHVDLTNVVGAILLSMAVSQAYWGAPDPRSLVLFCLTIVVLEVFVYLRWRASIICNLCGFDPVIYKRSPELAAQRVRAFYQEREETPEFWLSRSPLLERKRQGRVQERKASEYKRLEAKMLAKRPVKSASPLAPPKAP